MEDHSGCRWDEETKKKKTKKKKTKKKDTVAKALHGQRFPLPQ